MYLADVDPAPASRQAMRSISTRGSPGVVRGALHPGRAHQVVMAEEQPLGLGAPEAPAPEQPTRSAPTSKWTRALPLPGIGRILCP